MTGCSTLLPSRARYRESQYNSIPHIMNASEGSVWLRKKKREMDQTKGNKVSYEKNDKGRDNKKEKYGLMRYDELPEYMKDNEYILNHYRANWPLKQAFFSLFRWHNETLNVWAHLIGFALFVGLTVCHVMYVPQVADFFGVFPSSYPMTPEANSSHTSSKLISINPSTILTMGTHLAPISPTRWPFFVFLSGSMFCLLSSSTCHLFCCHSHDLNILLLRMDYVGIVVMIITSFFPPVYYIFQCDPLWQIIYLSGISTMGIFTIVTLLTPAFSTNKFRSFRALLFVAMGLFGILPATHSVIVNWNDPKRDVTLAYEAVMALSYLIGTVFYVTRVPERWRPGWFDLVGHSHQIFHVFVIMGALAHYGAALIFLKHRGNVVCNMK